MRLLLYGSRDFARTVSELVRHCSHEVAGMIDDYNTGPGIVGTLTEAAKRFPPSEYGIALAIGYTDLPARWAAWQRLKGLGYAMPALIHPRAYVADSAHIGPGAMVMAGVIVDMRAEIGEAAVLWPGACISHDARIGANTFVSPNATVCGFARIGAHSFIGAGAAVVDRGLVPEGCTIKMLSRWTQKAP
jgi:sugar O-acyltransferase (sialic acid O-acetyltransferase NeuD family)